MSAGDALLRDVVRRRRGRVAAAALLLGAHQGFEALVPVVVGATLDAAVEPSDGGALVLWLAVLAVVFVLLSNAFRFGFRIGTRTVEETGHDLRMRLVTRVLDPRGGGEGGRRPGELLSVATGDVDAAAGVVQAIAFGAGVSVALVAGAAVLLLTSVQLGLVVLVGLPIVLYLASLLGKPLTRRAAGQQGRAADAAGVAADLVGGLRVLQGIGAMGAAAARYRAASRSSLAATMGAARAEAVFEATAVLVAGVALFVVALLGGRLAADGEITIGQLIAALGVTQFLVGPLGRLAWVGTLWARARASADRLAEALAAPPAVQPPAPASRETGFDPDMRGRNESREMSGPAGLVVRGLRHGPLDGLDLDVAPGAVHGLVVPDPAAAAALLDVLGREVTPAAGVVTAGGTDVTTLDPAVARATVVVSPHDAALLADTVLANVAAGAAAGATDLARPDSAPVCGADPRLAAGGDVERAIAAAAVDEVVAALPDGLHTRLTDGGQSLSGGQRQRIALARALAAPAPVLVLHEPTTALDAATEARVAAALRPVRGDRTTVLVTTSPALLAVCDAVTVLRDGRAGPPSDHAALVAGDAAYRTAVLA